MGGYSAWDLPLSVAQHSLAVLALRLRRFAERPLTGPEARRELLHDATEALMGGWDPITPLKPHLGPGFSALVARLQAAVDHGYDLPAWTSTDYALHKQADRLAAANEAYHVVGWSRAAMREQLRIELDPLEYDPLDLPPDQRAWEPWPPKLAQTSFLRELQALSADQSPASAGARPAGGTDVDAISPLAGLTEMQARAAAQYGAVLVLAGAGTGKTARTHETPGFDR